jgi:hypothetical protein
MSSPPRLPVKFGLIFHLIDTLVFAIAGIKIIFYTIYSLWIKIDNIP